MNYNDDYNPFADSSIKQATAASYGTQQANNEYNPFTNTNPSAPAAQPPQFPNIPAVLPPTQPAAYQSESYPAVKPTPISQSADKYSSDNREASTRVDLSSFERQQSEIERHEKRNVADQTLILKREKNFPPLPKACPCGPCFYQNIDIEIPPEFKNWVRYLYYLWLAYAITLFVNFIAGLSYFVVDKDGGATFGLSLVYFFLFVPLSYICWFRPIYRAFRIDSSVSFMLFFVIDAMFIVHAILFATGLIGGMCGFARIGIIGHNTFVGVIMIILGLVWSLIALTATLLTIRVHRLYRQSGASLEQAQREFQTAFVNNPTVRGAARDVATAGVKEAVKGGLN